MSHILQERVIQYHTHIALKLQSLYQPTHHAVTASVVSSRYTADIPYTATLTTIYADGTKDVKYDYEGVYHGAQIDEVKVIYSEAVLLST